MIPPHINLSDVNEDPQDLEDEYGEGYCYYCDNDGNECICGDEDEWCDVCLENIGDCVCDLDDFI